MVLAIERLIEIINELVSRPQHEKVRALVHELLVNGLGANSTELDFEKRVPEVHGRIDALIGRTLFEFKSDLRREQRDAENKLPDYLSQREQETGLHFIGVVTDGATFITFGLRGNELIKYESFTPSLETPRKLLEWLSSVVAVNEELEPNSDVVQRELGRHSLAWNIAKQELSSLWSELHNHPDVKLKRDLWEQLLRRVYGTALNEDVLFLQHTYLTIIAKTMAAKVLAVSISEPSELLSGQPFREAGIGGVIESDFFDWPLVSNKGPDFVRRVALQASRFKLEEVQTDVLKGLYESLIDPDQRHLLGEYYTPDWLAERICEKVITKPLEQRVLDPACGSGTFIFHAVRRLLKTAEQNGMTVPDAIELACNHISGIDVHPVSAQIARVTFLLALGPERLKNRPPNINIPIYIGDSTQWNTRGFLAERDVLIEIPDSNNLLEFPFEITRDPNLFDAVIGRMLELSTQNATAEGLVAWLERNFPLSQPTLETLKQTYEILHNLEHEGKDHIWGFITRNLVRPIWLSQNSQKVDIVIGNPPWLSYRFMDNEFQTRFRKECMTYGIWHGQVAQQQDLSGYFFVRCTALYVKEGGTIAFVMPYAAMTRRQFARLRTGLYGASQTRTPGLIHVTVQFIDAWAFTDAVKPLFPVPSCVLFAKSGDGEGPRLPAKIQIVTGILPKRDASLQEAIDHLVWHEDSWPSERTDRITEGYASSFRDGATIFPRILFTVIKSETGMLGVNAQAPLVESRRSTQEKPPWKGLPPLRGNIETEFLYPLYLGESIAPYRVLTPILALIPWDKADQILLSSENAQSNGYTHLARWLKNAEQLWEQHGSGKRSLLDQLNYYGQLTAQFPITPLKIAYSKAGSLPAATLINNNDYILDHTLYWANVNSKQEAYYLLSILNSETARALAESNQARGQWGARHFDKVMLALPIPKFSSTNALHQKLVRAAKHAETVANVAQIDESVHFISVRRKIRDALLEDGISKRIDQLVEELLNQ